MCYSHQHIPLSFYKTMSTSQTLQQVQQEFKDDVNRDPDRFRLWEDLVFDVYQGDEGQLKSLQNRVKNDDFYNGFSLLIDIDNSGSICVNSEIPNIARPFVCLLIFQIALQAPPNSFLYSFVMRGFLDRLLVFAFERVNPILLPKWSLERLFNLLVGMNHIDGGRYSIGSGKPYEFPIKHVDIADFSISVYPITQIVYHSIMEKNPSAFVGATKPVELVSWYDAVRFCNQLSVKMGLEEVYTIGRGSEPEVITDTSKYGYRLPTEAEWEIAAGENLELGWHKTERNPVQNTQCVGYLRPNKHGLYDMSGNVWEWCQDVYQHNFIGVQGPPTNVHDARRVRKGGSWMSNADGCTSSYRSDRKPYYVSENLGFRIAMTTY